MYIPTVEEITEALEAIREERKQSNFLNDVMEVMKIQDNLLEVGISIEGLSKLSCGLEIGLKIAELKQKKLEIGELEDLYKKLKA